MSSFVAPGNLFIGELPNVLSIEIFSYLTPADLGHCCELNSALRRLASDNRAWRESGRQRFGQYLNVPNVKDFLRACHLQQLRSNDEVVDRIRDFANRVSMGHNGRFRCILSTGRGHRVISVEIKGDRTKLHPVLGTPRELQDNVREFDIKDTAYASHVVGRCDLINPEPLDMTRWIGSWGGKLGMGEKIWDCTREPFHVVLRFPHPLESETDFNTWNHFSTLGHSTQMQQKIANILQRKVVSLNAQNDREQNKRILVIGAAAILLLSFVMRIYLNSVSSQINRI